MRVRDLSSLGSLARLGAFLLPLTIVILACAASALAQTPSAQQLKNWRDGLAHAPPPQEGCFTSSYPNTQWQEVPCSAAVPRHPFLPARGPRVSSIGNGTDVAVGVTSGHISLSEGSFDSVTGVTSVTSANGSNDYSLQLNSNTFSSPVCAGAGTPANCVGWEQFIYSNGQCSSGSQSGLPCTFIQYWLLRWGSTTCPSGWNFFNNGGDDECYRNSNILVPPQVQPLSNLGNLAVIAEASSGGNDAVIFSTGTTLYAVQNNDNVLSLAGGWTGLEYNIVGDGGGSAANFNSGASLVVRASLDNGSPSAPSCLSSFSGFTGETNNLNFAGAPAAIRGTTPAIMFAESSSGSAPTPCSSATAIASGALVDSHDFNADGKSDILWQNTSGSVAVWEMNGSSILQSAGVGTVPTVWSVVGQRDFNGDGKADILWRDTSGDVAVWLMNGATILQSLSVGNANPSVWSVVGTGDFNGDGYADILWHDTSGDVAIWEMNGNTIVQSCSVGNANPSVWSIAGTGDFNGDGKSDILWRDTSGDVAIWEMNGATILQSLGVGTASPSVWSIVQTGDYYGAGTSDILWRDTSGDVAVWEMNGATIVQSAGIGTASTVWSVQGAGAD